MVDSSSHSCWCLQKTKAHKIRWHWAFSKNSAAVSATREGHVGDLPTVVKPDTLKISLEIGNIGDGNVHIIIHVGPETKSFHLQIDEIIYGLIRELSGAVSAEHGIGLMKKQFLPYSKSEPEIALMKALKQTMDPRSILNPGRIS